VVSYRANVPTSFWAERERELSVIDILTEDVAAGMIGRSSGSDGYLELPDGSDFELEISGYTPRK